MSRPIKAAGGILTRRNPGGDVEVAVVHRPRYDDWTLPKGKLHRGETDEQGALREVEEETGLRCVIERPAGRVRYRDRTGRSKEVAYFHMTPEGGAFRPNREVDELRWLPVEDAKRLLTYERDRALLGGVADSPRI